MRLNEFIQTRLSQSLNYDPKTHRIRLNRCSNVEPELTLRDLNTIKKRRWAFQKQAEQKRKFRSVMYGGAGAAERDREEIEQAEHELGILRAEVANQIDAAEIEQGRKDDLTTMARRYVKKAGSDG